MAREGGYEWYQSKGLIFIYISTDFKKILKDHGPLKNKKRIWAGKQLLMGRYWIKGRPGLKTENRRAERPFYGFCVIPEWGVLELDYVYSMFFEDLFRNEKIHMHYQTKPGKQGFSVDLVCILHREIWIVHKYCNCL
jgi:hypothetical protein